jgi:hypothetical protein
MKMSYEDVDGMPCDGNGRHLDEPVSAMTSAAICRKHGWQVGDRLIDFLYTSIVIEMVITAIGEDRVLGRTVTVGDRPFVGDERTFNLVDRNWRKVCPK